METLTLNFAGETCVSRGQWRMTVPVQFSLTLAEEFVDDVFVEQISVYLAKLFTQTYVENHDSEYRDAMLFDDDDD